jgi:EAL domain-containing protein (putative c-di-GMP-specific phosphodiesterase class I)
MVCELRPEYVKLDKSLVQNVEKPMYGATIRKVVELADRFSVRVIATGVETIHTMENLWLLGVQHMQGHLFGRPERNVSGSEAGLLRLAHALAPQQAYDADLITTPVSISCRPGSTTPARKQESSDRSLARR